MDIQLGSVGLRLQTPDHLISQGWRTLFTGWQANQPAGRETPITLDLSLTETLAEPPAVPAIFQHPLTGMLVYEVGDGWQLRFPGRAVIHGPTLQNKAPVQINGQVTAPATQPTLLEDITFTALAPWLRRQGRYLIHAFAVAQKGRACLLVGPSLSGKTTTGLRLAQAGWQLLGNDLVLMENRPEGVFAWPTPGQIRIRPGTLNLLPGLSSAIDHQLPNGGAILNRELLSLPAANRPEPITHIFFPHVRPAVQTAFTPLSQGVTFARLGEESLDRWDTVTLADHLDCLQNLSLQVEGVDLLLGHDAGTFIPQLLTD